MEMDSEEITLKIEDKPVKCTKQELITNSDYFKAMFEGNFIERGKTEIKLQDVNLSSMEIILKLIRNTRGTPLSINSWCESYFLEIKEVLVVLQTACMLQFENIKKGCIYRISNALSSTNCLKIWHATERLCIKPLFLVAKAMALEEFLQIQDTDCILELSFEDAYYYLGHIHLNSGNELSVFRTAMKWWHGNKQYVENESPLKMLLKLLSCIDYQNLSDNHLKEIMLHPDIISNLELSEILACVKQIKNKESINDFSEVDKERAQLLFQSKSRQRTPEYPCFLLKNVEPVGKNKKSKITSYQQHKVISYYGRYGHERFYDVLDNYWSHNEDCNLTIVYYDLDTKKFKFLVEVADKKLKSLDGFKLAGYKRSVFLYGGEFLMGKGKWNYDVLKHDVFLGESSRMICPLPFPRRHFDSCRVKDYLYVVGGTGPYRVIQENMFWYHYHLNRWYPQSQSPKKLPLPGRQLKCCEFLNQLFILYISDKCGFLYDHSDGFKRIALDVDDSVINKLCDFSIFSYKNDLYFKGVNLLRFTVKEKGDKLILLTVKEITNLAYDKMEIAVCNNIVYTLYKSLHEDIDVYSFEYYDLDTDYFDFLFRCAPNDRVVDFDGKRGNDKNVFHSSLIVFSFPHYDLIEDNKLVNDCFKFLDVSN